MRKNIRSPLHEMTCTTPTVLWNDSCAIAELTYALENGAVGATSNPVIVGEVLKKEWELWKDRIPQIIRDLPAATEDEVAWKLIEEVSARAAALLIPAFERSGGYNGRLSIQTDPRLYRDSERIVAQAEHFDALAPNMIVKIPVTAAGIVAIEEATYRGVSINATVSFSVPQALAVAEAVERGLQRREKQGKSILSMGPVCTIMVGRLDDWLKVVADQENIITDPGNLEWAGVAAMKKAYRIYQERATACACCRLRSAITCTGPSSSAGTSLSRRRINGRSVSTPLMSQLCHACRTRWMRRSWTSCMASLPTSDEHTTRTACDQTSSTPFPRPPYPAPVHRSLRRCCTPDTRPHAAKSGREVELHSASGPVARAFVPAEWDTSGAVARRQPSTAEQR